MVANFREKEVLLHKNQIIGKGIPQPSTGVYPIDTTFNKEINNNPQGFMKADRDDARKQFAEKSGEHATTTQAN